MQKRPAEDKLDSRSPKKQKIESSSIFLSLPKDILLEICHYITRVEEDAMRFELTCKSIRSLIVEVLTELHIVNSDNFEQMRSTLSRDLRFLQTLSIEFCFLGWEQTNWLVIKLSTVLPKLRNLKTLKLNFQWIGRSGWKMSYSGIMDTLPKLTWLEALDCQYPLLSDLGEAFANHSKLTELIISGATKDLIETPHIIKGFDKLTQVKALTLHSQMTDDNNNFHEVLQLTNLTALDLKWMKLPAEATKNISRLTNLERLVCPMNVVRGPWKSLPSLTKLTSLEGHIDTADNDIIDNINQMTQLTSLKLHRMRSRNITPEKLANLTNLQKLVVHDAICSANFAVLSNLTQLSIDSWNILQVDDVTLPQSLKSLEISQHIDSNTFMEIVQLTSLETLSIFLSKTWCKANVVTEISNLTNLRELSLRLGWDDSLPSELGESLQKLSLLQSVYVNEICQKDIAQLKQLTQLNQLNVNDPVDIDLKTLREQLPFIVYKRRRQRDRRK